MIVQKERNRIIKQVNKEYLEKSRELVEQVFTEYSNEEEGKAVRSLIKKIRKKKLYS